MKGIEVAMRAGPSKFFRSEEQRPEYPGYPKPKQPQTPTVRFEGVFVVVTDARGMLTAIPAADVREVREFIQ